MNKHFNFKYIKITGLNGDNLYLKTGQTQDYIDRAVKAVEVTDWVGDWTRYECTPVRDFYVFDISNAKLEASTEITPKEFEEALAEHIVSLAKQYGAGDVFLLNFKRTSERMAILYALMKHKENFWRKAV